MFLRYELSPYILDAFKKGNQGHGMANSVAGPSPQRTRFDSRSVHMRFLVDKVAVGQVFLRVPQFYSVNVILSFSCINRTYQMEKTGEVWKPSKK